MGWDHGPLWLFSSGLFRPGQVFAYFVRTDMTSCLGSYIWLCCISLCMHTVVVYFVYFQPTALVDGLHTTAASAWPAPAPSLSEWPT
jgi:hypothetical protein